MRPPNCYACEMLDTHGRLNEKKKKIKQIGSVSFEHSHEFCLLDCSGLLGSRAPVLHWTAILIDIPDQWLKMKNTDTTLAYLPRKCPLAIFILTNVYLSTQNRMTDIYLLPNSTVPTTVKMYCTCAPVYDCGTRKIENEKEIKILNLL